MLPTVLCLATSHEHAERLVDALEAANVPTADISALALPSEPGGKPESIRGLQPQGSEGTAEKAKGGAAAGTVAGAAAGVAVMGNVGLTPLLIFAPFIVGAGALIGATAGAAAAAGLSDYGIPQAQLDYYYGKLYGGGYLVSVRSEDESELDRAKGVFERNQGQDIQLYRFTKKLT